MCEKKNPTVKERPVFKVQAWHVQAAQQKLTTRSFRSWCEHRQKGIQIHGNTQKNSLEALRERLETFNTFGRTLLVLLWGLSTVLTSKQQWSGFCFGIKQRSKHLSKSSFVNLNHAAKALLLVGGREGLRITRTHLCIVSRRNQYSRTWLWAFTASFATSSCCFGGKHRHPLKKNRHSLHRCQERWLMSSGFSQGSNTQQWVSLAGDGVKAGMDRMQHCLHRAPSSAPRSG